MSSVKQTEQGAYLTLDPDKTKAIMASVETEVGKLEKLGKNPHRNNFSYRQNVFQTTDRRLLQRPHSCFV